jgi:class 3 adenylate cyclase
MGREAFAQRRWSVAYHFLAAADKEVQLNGQDLEALAEVCFASNQIPEGVQARERSYAAFEARHDDDGASRLAVMLAGDYMRSNSFAVAGGWINTANRLLIDLPESAGHAMQAFLQGMMLTFQGDNDGAVAELRRATEIARRVGAIDPEMMSQVMVAYLLVQLGQVEEGMRLVDVAMTAAVSGRLRPFSATIVYCSTLEACVDVLDLGRALEWADVAKKCCVSENLVPATADCKLHRASVLRYRGDWTEAEAEARDSVDAVDWHPTHVGQAMYEIGAIQLLRGDLGAAEEAFQRSVEFGWRPQPGLARLRLAQGRVQAALTGITEAVNEETQPLARSRLLPAQVEIAVAAGNIDLATTAAARLRQDIAPFDSAGKQAELACAEGAVQLAAGDLANALTSTRRGAKLWQQIGSPYEASRAQVQCAEVQIARGDADAAAMELRAAVATFERLGALLDARRAISVLTGLEGALEKETGSTKTVRRAFMFTDIVKSTDLIAVIGDEAWADVLRWHDQTLGTLFGTHRGEEVDHAGDGFLVVFPQVNDALECAIEIQRKLAEHRRSHGFAPQLRIGVHSDVATYSGRHYSGRGVHKAARIASLADGGEIIATRDVVQGRPFVGEPQIVQLKGIDEPVEVVRLAWKSV